MSSARSRSGGKRAVRHGQAVVELGARRRRARRPRRGRRRGAVTSRNGVAAAVRSRPFGSSAASRRLLGVAAELLDAVDEERAAAHSRPMARTAASNRAAAMARNGPPPRAACMTRRDGALARAGLAAQMERKVGGERAADATHHRRRQERSGSLAGGSARRRSVDPGAAQQLGDAAPQLARREAPRQRRAVGSRPVPSRSSITTTPARRPGSGADPVRAAGRGAMISCGGGFRDTRRDILVDAACLHLVVAAEENAHRLADGRRVVDDENAVQRHSAHLQPHSTQPASTALRKYVHIEICQKKSTDFSLCDLAKCPIPPSPPLVGVCLTIFLKKFMSAWYLGGS